MMRGVLLMFAIGFGCGSDENRCEAVNQRICDLACACTAGPACTLTSGVASATHDTAANCKGFQVTFGCMQESSIDFEACNAALDTATCADDALQMPAECGFGF